MDVFCPADSGADFEVSKLTAQERVSRSVEPVLRIIEKFVMFVDVPVLVVGSCFCAELFVTWFLHEACFEGNLTFLRNARLQVINAILLSRPFPKEPRTHQVASTSLWVNRNS